MTSAAADPNRDEFGRFLPGNKAAAGNKGGSPPSMEHIRRFNQAIRDGVSMRDLGEIVATAVQQAKEGDRFARRWLWDRVVGRPTQSIVQGDGTGSVLEQLLDALADDVEEGDDAETSRQAGSGADRGNGRAGPGLAPAVGRSEDPST